MSLPGVYKTKLKNGTPSFRASLTFEGKHISLGSYESEITAHKAYLCAQQILSDSSITIEQYFAYKPLAFQKWVSMVNLRDNHMYFSNPIYLRKSYFSYYLDKQTEIKFDLDDLFYYARHKLMRRGGHLFVSDYGMQYNIHAKYGIKNYAVLNRDYRFRNEDPFDYRYENLEILNAYHGVRLLHKHSAEGCRYQARLHVKSYYNIGHYSSALEAAIAYNKAIDIVKKNGLSTSYEINYIDSISPAVYADIYTNIPISESIYKIGNENKDVKDTPDDEI